MRLCLFQPDMPQNTGAAIRLCAGFNVPLDIIEPCGFPLDDAKLRRVAMDYGSHLTLERHSDWTHFQEWRLQQRPAARLILMTTKASVPYHRFEFHPSDILMAGRESSGVPDFVHEAADARIIIPIHSRSFNIIIASGIVLAEALRQTNGLRDA